MAPPGHGLAVRIEIAAISLCLKPRCHCINVLSCRCGSVFGLGSLMARRCWATLAGRSELVRGLDDQAVRGPGRMFGGFIRAVPGAGFAKMNVTETGERY